MVYFVKVKKQLRNQLGTIVLCKLYSISIMQNENEDIKNYTTP